ncbi:zinc-binding dehydrogenase [Aeromonas media]|uniref:zinc-binding dehydrogenase n=1 Tax=Aeromonas media TaxID=651 RepID=UPI003B218664
MPSSPVTASCCTRRRGGVGLIVAQWAKLLGLTVIGTVSSDAKAELARAHGCDFTIDYSREDVATRAGREHTLLIF